MSDSEFCKTCGSILPLPGDENFVICYNRRCRRTVLVSEIEVDEPVTTVFYSKMKDNIAKFRMEKMDAERQESGATVERTCSKCGHERMFYTTCQTRSVDEGQTIFYHCPKCKGNETENS